MASIISQSFPCVIVPESNHNLAEVISNQRQLVNDLLLKSKAVLLRGFDVNSASDFGQVIEAFGDKAYDFSGGAWLFFGGPRFFQLDLPKETPLNYHNEGSYLTNPPRKMMLYCDVAPRAGEGATTILDGHALYKKMSELFPEFVQELEEKKLLYGRKLDERSWKRMFGSCNMPEVEQRADKIDSSIEWVKEDNGAVWNSNLRDGVVKDEARGGQKVWFNSIMSMMETYETYGSYPPTFGDGTPLPKEPLETCKKLMKQLEVKVSWNKGDVLLIDNKAIMHAKQPCHSERAIYISLAA